RGAVAEGAEATRPSGPEPWRDRDLANGETGGPGQHQQLGLEQEAAAPRSHRLEHRPRVDAKSGLCVGDGPPRQPVDEEARHAQGVETRGLHGGAAVGEPAADDDRSGQGRGRREEPRDVLGVVLPITVEGDDALGATPERLLEADAERRTLAAATRRGPSPPGWPKSGASDTGSRTPSASRSRSSQSSSAGSPLPEP